MGETIRGVLRPELNQEQIDEPQRLREQVASEVQRLFERSLSDRTGLWANWRTPDYATEHTIVSFELAGVGLDSALLGKSIMCSTDGSLIKQGPGMQLRDAWRLDQAYQAQPLGFKYWGYRALRPVEEPLEPHLLERPGYEDLKLEEMRVLVTTLGEITQEAYAGE
ncbi:hypothetical protein KW803_00240 [Candidatus Saccharibacteria bacterium]|nr:hypothetical protein [Candidatus Saccharibacteria bacterium]